MKSLAAIPAGTLREALPALLSAWITDPEAAQASQQRVQRLLDEATDEQMSELAAHLEFLGEEDRFFAAQPLARRFAREWCVPLLVEWEVLGLEHLHSARALGPTLLLCNHLSYLDTTATDALLLWSGAEDVANHIVAIAGPKVYADPFRRFAAASLNTLPAPQSTRLDGTASIGPRELARKALESVRLAHEALDSGFIPLLYPEGSRTRTGQMRPFLKAVARYLRYTDLRVVPMSIVGTDRVFPVDADRLQPAPVRIAFGEPLLVIPEDERGLLERVHGKIAELLPEAYRPLPDEPAIQ